MSETGTDRSGGKGNNERNQERNGNRKKYEGFDGMNYEQIRQPYNPSNNRERENNHREGNGKRRDEY